MSNSSQLDKGKPVTENRASEINETSVDSAFSDYRQNIIKETGGTPHLDECSTTQTTMGVVKEQNVRNSNAVVNNGAADQDDTIGSEDIHAAGTVSREDTNENMFQRNCDEPHKKVLNDTYFSFFKGRKLSTKWLAQHVKEFFEAPGFKTELTCEQSADVSELLNSGTAEFHVLLRHTTIMVEQVNEVGSITISLTDNSRQSMREMGKQMYNRVFNTSRTGNDRHVNLDGSELTIGKHETNEEGDVVVRDVCRNEELMGMLDELVEKDVFRKEISKCIENTTKVLYDAARIHSSGVDVINKTIILLLHLVCMADSATRILNITRTSGTLRGRELTSEIEGAIVKLHFLALSTVVGIISFMQKKYGVESVLITKLTANIIQCLPDMVELSKSCHECSQLINSVRTSEGLSAKGKAYKYYHPEVCEEVTGSAAISMATSALTNALTGTVPSFIQAMTLAIEGDVYPNTLCMVAPPNSGKSMFLNLLVQWVMDDIEGPTFKRSDIKHGKAVFKYRSGADAAGGQNTEWRDNLRPSSLGIELKDLRTLSVIDMPGFPYETVEIAALADFDKCVEYLRTARISQMVILLKENLMLRGNVKEVDDTLREYLLAVIKTYVSMIEPAHSNKVEWLLNFEEASNADEMVDEDGAPSTIFNAGNKKDEIREWVEWVRSKTDGIGDIQWMYIPVRSAETVDRLVNTTTSTGPACIIKSSFEDCKTIVTKVVNFLNSYKSISIGYKSTYLKAEEKLDYLELTKQLIESKLLKMAKTESKPGLERKLDELIGESDILAKDYTTNSEKRKEQTIYINLKLRKMRAQMNIRNKAIQELASYKCGGCCGSSHGRHLTKRDNAIDQINTYKNQIKDHNNTLTTLRVDSSEMDNKIEANKREIREVNESISEVLEFLNERNSDEGANQNNQDVHKIWKHFKNRYEDIKRDLRGKASTYRRPSRELLMTVNKLSDALMEYYTRRKAINSGYRHKIFTRICEKDRDGSLDIPEVRTASACSKRIRDIEMNIDDLTGEINGACEILELKKVKDVHTALASNEEVMALDIQDMSLRIDELERSIDDMMEVYRSERAADTPEDNKLGTGREALSASGTN